LFEQTDAVAAHVTKPLTLKVGTKLKLKKEKKTEVK
jgi:hypothetical protein